MSDLRQQAFLEEMGVGPLWRSRNAHNVENAPMVSDASDASDHPIENEVPLSARSIAEPVLEAVSAQVLGEASLTSHELPEIAPIDSSVVVANDAVASMSWMQLKSTVAGCEQCGLCKKRTNTVFGVGDEKAKWLFIGEGPGRNEDLQGEPFVGPAGKLLDNMLLSLGLKRGDNAYIANIVKCRPTDANGKDRPPTQQEADACLPFLQRQIALIQPNVIVALGKTAAISLLKRDPETAVSSLRGKVHQYAGLPLIVTYHPAYLLRNLPDKRKAWADLCLAVKAFANAGTE
jgi:uracil-DNA glycosylase family 4